MIRADSLGKLTPVGWAALEAYGVRTIIDLRNDDEVERRRAARPPGMRTIHLPHDAIALRDGHEEWQAGTPLYYAGHLERFPERSAGVIAAVAEAPPGGVAVHCVDGPDRTGLIAVLLLALVGVERQEILADYALSDERMARAWAEQGYAGYAEEMASFLAGRGTSAASSSPGCSKTSTSRRGCTPAAWRTPTWPRCASA